MGALRRTTRRLSAVFATLLLLAVLAAPEAAHPAKTVTISTSSLTITEGDTSKKDVTINFKLGENTPFSLDFIVRVVAASSTATDNTNRGRTSCSAPSSGADICYVTLFSEAYAPIAGGTNGSFKIGILGDTIDEGASETVAIRLEPSDGARRDGWTQNSNTLTLTITDNDTATSVPAKPAGLSATAGINQVALSWTDPGNSSITGYQVQKKKGSVAWGSWAAITGAGARTRSHTVTGLDSGSAYSFRIRAVNGAGNSPQSDTVTATPTAIPAPTNLRASPGNARVRLSWTKPAGTITGYKLRYGKTADRDSATWAAMASSSGTTTTHTLTGLDNDAEYSFMIRAVNASVDGTATDWVTATPVATCAPPAAPKDVRIMAGPRRLVVSWTAGTDANRYGWDVNNAKTGQAGYTIPTPDHWRIVTLPFLQANVEYTVKVRSKSSGISCPPGDWVTVTGTPLAPVPAAPTGLRAAAGNAQVLLSWDDPDDDTITGYQVQSKKGIDDWSSWADIAGSNSGTTSHTVRNLDNGEPYRFRLRAVNSDGNGLVAAQSATPKAVPRPVLTATAGNGSVTLNWKTLPGVAVTGWGYQYKSDATWTETVAVAAGNRQAGISGLTNGTVYTFRLLAKTSGAESLWSDEVTATPTGPTPTVVVTPTTLTMNEGGGSKYTVVLAGVKPTGNVRVKLTSVAGGRDDREVATLVFRDYNWNVPKPVTVYGPIDDTLGDYSFTITHTVEAAGTNYASATADSVVVSIVDTTATLTLADDPAAVAEGADISLTVTSDRALTGQIPVKLTFADRASSGFAAADLPGGLVQTLAADFGSTGGTTGTVTIPTNRDSAISEGAETYRVTLGDDSTQNGYKLGTDTTADGTLNDDAPGTPTAPGTTKGVTVVPMALTAGEGASAGFLVWLDAAPAPSGDVIVTISGDTEDVTITTQGQAADARRYAGKLIFTTANWRTPQWVRVWVREDTDMQDDDDVVLVLTASGGGYDDVRIPDVRVTVKEDDKSSMSPGGAEATRNPPGSAGPPPSVGAAPGDESVTLAWSDPGDPEITRWEYRQKTGAGAYGDWTGIPGSRPETRTHTVRNLANETPYTFRVRAVKAVGAGTPSPEVTATPAAAQPKPTDPAADPEPVAEEPPAETAPEEPPAATAPEEPPAVAVPDEQPAPVEVVSAPEPGSVTVSRSTLPVTEGGSGTYTIVLDRAPDADVVVTVGGATGDVTVSPKRLTFTTGNWDTAQTVTVNSGRDEDTRNDTATLTHTASSTDTAYGASLDIDDVNVTVTDTTPTLQLLTDPAAVTEGTAISLTVTSDKAVPGTLPVSLTLAARGSSGFDADDITGTLGPREFTVSFEEGSMTGTVTIPTQADRTREGPENYAITLNDAAGYAVGTDATAGGVLNDGPTGAVGRANRVNAAVLPQVAAAMTAQTLDALTSRIEAVASGAVAEPFEFGALPASPTNTPGPDRWAFMEPTGPRLSDLLAGAAFHMPITAQSTATGAENQKHRAAVWGRGARTAFSGAEDDVSWDGSLWSGHLGGDLRLRPDLLVGAAVSHARSETDAETDGVKSVHEAELTAVHPYAAWMPRAGLLLWASAGYGAGEVQITEENEDPRAADLTLARMALGGRGRLVENQTLIAGGTTRIGLRGEGSFARARTEGSDGLEKLTVDASRLRLAIEGSHERDLDGGLTLTPALEAGLRYDIGDAAEGAGIEAGGSLTWYHPNMGLTVAIRGRALLVHEADRDEWGLSALLRLDPGPQGEGTFLTLAPGHGKTGGELDGLFDRMRGPRAAGPEPAGRLDAEVGHGYRLARNGALLTPYAGLALAEHGDRALRLGLRYKLAATLSLALEAQRREGDAQDDDNGVMIEGAFRW